MQAGSGVVAIFIHGSGQASFDANFTGLSFFRELAYGLYDHGISSVRFNKRYWQHPAPPDMTIWSETIDDVFHAIDYAHDVLGYRDIILVGFSNGGIVAPVIAQMDDRVTGLISHAGSPRPLLDIIGGQEGFLRYMGANMGLADIEAPISEVLRPLLYLGEGSFLHNLLSPIFVDIGFPLTLLSSMHELNVADAALNLSIPMLFLQGSKDLQILAEYDFAAWVELLHGRDNAAFMLYEGLNHFFTPHDAAFGFNQAAAPGPIYYGVIYDIQHWITNRR